MDFDAFDEFGNPLAVDNISDRSKDVGLSRPTGPELLPQAAAVPSTHSNQPVDLDTDGYTIGFDETVQFVVEDGTEHPDEPALPARLAVTDQTRVSEPAAFLSLAAPRPDQAQHASRGLASDISGAHAALDAAHAGLSSAAAEVFDAFAEPLIAHRVVAVVGSILSGKTSAVDTLLRSRQVSIVPPVEPAAAAPFGPAMGIDFDSASPLWAAANATEKARGLTLGTRAISAVVSCGTRRRLMTFLDTPGHPGMFGPAAVALRTSDCAVVTVSAIDGVTPVTEAALRVAAAEGSAVVLHITNVDRLCLDMRLQPHDSALKLFQIIEAVNAILRAGGVASRHVVATPVIPSEDAEARANAPDFLTSAGPAAAVDEPTATVEVSLLTSVTFSCFGDAIFSVPHLLERWYGLSHPITIGITAEEIPPSLKCQDIPAGNCRVAAVRPGAQSSSQQIAQWWAVARRLTSERFLWDADAQAFTTRQAGGLECGFAAFILRPLWTFLAVVVGHEGDALHSALREFKVESSPGERSQNS